MPEARAVYELRAGLYVFEGVWASMDADLEGGVAAVKFLVSDDPKYLLDCWERDGLLCYLWDSPENQDFEDPNFLRVGSFEQLEKEVTLDQLIFGERINPQEEAARALNENEGKGEDA